MSEYDRANAALRRAVEDWNAAKLALTASAQGSAQARWAFTLLDLAKTKLQEAEQRYRAARMQKIGGV